MSHPTVSVEGRRVYIATPYGHPVVSRLKELGAHWDAGSRRWWIGVAKKDEVEKAVATCQAQPQAAAAEDPDKIKVIGKATYKGRSYYVRWIGETKSGAYKARLVSIDGKIDFWANAARPHELHNPPTDTAVVTKTFRDERSLASIREYVEDLKSGRRQPADSKPDEECYERNGEWLVRGCSECSRLGTMCRSCRHDIYDS